MKAGLYAQISIIEEFLSLHNTRDIADEMIEYIADDGVECTVYSTTCDNIVLRIKKDKATVSDSDILKFFVKSLRKIIDKDEEFADIISDNYDFLYKPSLITEETFGSLITIRRNGRLISLDIDYN